MILNYTNREFHLDRIIEASKWHDKESVYEHSKHTLNNMASLLEESMLFRGYFDNRVGRYSKRDLFLLVPILHDIGKVKTIQIVDGGTKCPNHEQQSVFEAVAILRHFEFEDLENKYVLNIIRHHGELNSILNRRNDPDFRNLLKNFENKNKDILLELCLHMIADTKDGYYKTSEPEDYEFRINFVNKLISKLCSPN